MVPAANPVPATFSCWDQIFDEPGPPDFQSRYGVPLASVNAEGSIEPPRDCWHSSGHRRGVDERPLGLLAVATEMHSVPVAGDVDGVVHQEVPLTLSPTAPRCRWAWPRPAEMGVRCRSRPNASGRSDAMIWMFPATELVA